MKLKISAPVRIILIAAIIMLNIGCDQVSKHIVRENIGEYQNISLLYNHFTLTKVENTGAFLSLGDSISPKLKFVLLTLIPVLVLVFAVGYLMVKKNLPKIPLIAACFIIGGGIGNIYDRLLYNSVTDFMHLRFGFLQTGIFNMADVSVSLGVIIMFVWYYIAGKNLGKADVIEA
ncbi:signal peptidase II [Mucilaginibacter mali]|uniref:Lipoprotein signal peptidase n=1 Tax=Mucilaginibacter mali TaxID=2740462 RepID=A0A7D4UPU3_9SPHI|nr:signal peptidase II [Mucilaginibacter mali]QKJ31120.1 signal peptidase II [Mucilaginibacter mali]